MCNNCVTSVWQGIQVGRNEEMVVNNKVAKYSDREAAMRAEDF